MIQKIKAHHWAWKRTALCAVIWLTGQLVLAQKNLPIIHATSLKVDVQDGNTFRKGVWNLSPEIKPDIYYALEHSKKKTTTFYTDVDSISFQVKPGHSYDFIILLNNRDSCFTRIESKEKTPPIKPTSMHPEQLQEDFSLLVGHLRREHGGLFRYKTQSELMGLSDSLFRTLDHPMNQYELAPVIWLLVNAIQDGHTGVHLPQELIAHYGRKVKMFPLQLWFIDEKAFVVCDKFKEIPSETEVLAIDGQPINEIKKRLFDYLNSDGAIESKKYWPMNHVAFPFLYSWVFGEKSIFDVAYKTREGKIKKVALKADFVKNTKCFHLDEDLDKNLQLEFKSKDVALLTVKSFNSKELMQTDEDYPKFLATSFKAIHDRKVKKLIIDLRHNAGGDDVYAALLYTYLTDKPFYFFGSRQKYHVEDYTNLTLENPNEMSFNGGVFFLINGLSFSATSIFSAIAKSNNRGVFIGEETGGAYYGGTAGDIFKGVLPNSHIRFSIPRDRYNNPVKKVKEEGRGVLPDYRIIPTIEEVFRKEDVQLKFALELAKKK